MKEKDANKKGFFKEFKEFITRGNILDLAVGVIIGGAFNAIVTALNQKVLMPVVNWALSFLSKGSELCTVLHCPGTVKMADYTGATAGVTPTIVNGVEYYSVIFINWSSLFEAIINFFFIALTLFIIVKVARFASEKRRAYEEKVRSKKNAEVEALSSEEVEK